MQPRAASTAGTVLPNGDGIEEKTTMVVVQPKVFFTLRLNDTMMTENNGNVLKQKSPSARISFSSIDTKRDIYMNQFDLQVKHLKNLKPT